jgi:hypothetical protein
MGLPLIALQRMRADSGSVILPGCPVPGSDKWSKDVIARRIRQGFVKKQDSPSAKAKAKSKSFKATSKKE